MNKFILCLLLSFSFQYFIIGQWKSGKEMEIIPSYEKKSSQKFTEINDPYRLNESNVFNYPLGENDFWEYIVVDTTKFLGFYEGLNYSVVKEIHGDTVMPNGLTYKIVKWEKCANSVNELPNIEYQRQDSLGNVYIYFDNQDKILYNFTANVGQQYPSHYPGFNWMVARKYTVSGFGNVYNAVDFVLRDQTNNDRRYETVIENFGLTYYSGDPNEYNDLPFANFYGGIINDTTYGKLLAKREEIDWNEFYPLNIGDFWKYEVWQSSITWYYYSRVIKDTLMSDGKIYKMLYNKTYGGPFPGEYFRYSRIEGNIVYSWHPFNNSASKATRFSSCLGDTVGLNNSDNYYWRVDDKDYDMVKFFLYPDLSFSGEWYISGLGLYRTSGSFSGTLLIGAIINGVIFGDTTTTRIDEYSQNPSGYFLLEQNYPNPFNSETVIGYRLSVKSKVMLKVYDIQGREVVILVNEEKEAGFHKVEFNAKGLPSGVYYYRLQSSGYVETKKMLLIK